MHVSEHTGFPASPAYRFPPTPPKSETKRILELPARRPARRWIAFAGLLLAAVLIVTALATVAWRAAL